LLDQILMGALAILRTLAVDAACVVEKVVALALELFQTESA